MGAELEKGRNLWAESSGGQIRKGPKPLATHDDIVILSSEHPLIFFTEFTLTKIKFNDYSFKFTCHLM